jgi:hypothetical protein
MADNQIRLLHIQKCSSTTISSTCFHPRSRLVASSSGERQLFNNYDDTEDDEDQQDLTKDSIRTWESDIRVWRSDGKTPEFTERME